MLTSRWIAACLLVLAWGGGRPACGESLPAPEKETTEERVIRLMGGVLQDFPARIKSLKPEIRRVVLYDFRLDRNTIKPELKRVLQSMIETEIAKCGQLQLVSVPEVKPIKVIVTEDNFKLTRGLTSIFEMKQVSEQHRLDGLVEADLYMSEHHLYLAMSVTDLQTGSVVWREKFFTKDAEPIIKGFSTSADLSAGLVFVPTTEIKKASSNPPTVGANASYYAVELRFTEPAFPSRAVDFVLKGGMMILANGASFAGGGYAKTGLRTGLIPKHLPEHQEVLERSNWLSIEGTFGVLFPTGEPSMTTLGLNAEVDVTRRFSFGAGLSYINPTNVLSGGSTIQVGGMVIELMAMKLYF